MSQGSVDWDDYFSARPYAEGVSFMMMDHTDPDYHDTSNSDRNNNINATITVGMFDVHKSCFPPQHFNTGIEDPRPAATSLLIGADFGLNPLAGYGSQLQLPVPASQHLTVDSTAVTLVTTAMPPKLGHPGTSKRSARIGRPSKKNKRTAVTPEDAAEQDRQYKIQNRMSSAKYRAKKKAYTDYLEKRLRELAEENHRIKQSEADATRKRRRELEEKMNQKMPTKAEKTAEKLRSLRRTSSFTG